MTVLKTNTRYDQAFYLYLYITLSKNNFSNVGELPSFKARIFNLVIFDFANFLLVWVALQNTFHLGHSCYQTLP